MKKTYLFLIFCMILTNSKAQSFINGSFENTTSSGCDYNNNASDFNAVMTNINAIPQTEQIDIQRDGCFISNIPDGDITIGLSMTDAIAIELSSPLISGNTYDISFDAYSNTGFESSIANVQIGVSTLANSIGSIIYTTSITTQDVWNEFIIEDFVAPNNGNYITVSLTNLNSGWTQIDDFNITTNTLSKNGYEYSNTIKIHPNPTTDFITISGLKNRENFRVYDILGTEIIKGEIIDNGEILVNTFKGDICFKNVNFSYVPNTQVLNNISFNIKKGSTVAIVGSTGAGKTSVINLLNRFYEINSGEISIDGINIKDYKLSNLRKNIGIVLQDVFLFSDSIFNNITLKDDTISLNQVKLAAKQIGVHNFIMSLPNNYYYNVKERGIMLSSGQRQLIAFLRVYVSDPQILILDEATSSIDSKSEILIQNATEKLTKNRTSLIIAHRLATIKKANNIIVMDSGNIIEQGSHKELISNLDGYYKKLYDVQFQVKNVS